MRFSLLWEEAEMNDFLKIRGREFSSRLFLGTGKFGALDVMADSIKRSGSELVTVALRRVSPGKSESPGLLEMIPKDVVVMTNTSGARNCGEAVRIARTARAAGCGDWIKIEVIPDSRHLFPDNDETVKATEILAGEGFIVMPYFNPDLVVARRLEKAGAASVMPLGSPIGSGRGLQTLDMIRILIQEIELPVVVDAGIGVPSHAAQAMEIGASAVLVNTAVAIASDPPAMAEAFAMAVRAGRTSFLSGAGDSFSGEADASSPTSGYLR